MNGDAIRRTADRLIDQLTHIQRTHGELSGNIFTKPDSTWCDPPIPETKPAYRGFDVFGGFVVTKLPGRTPRTTRKCWGKSKGGVSLYFDAESLERGRASSPAGNVALMPPDASCWLIELDNIIQSSIEAVEYLVSTQLAKELTGSKTDSSSIDMQQQKLEVSGQKPVERIAVEWNEEKILAEAAKQLIQLESKLKANESAIQSTSPGTQAHADLKSRIDELKTAVADAKNALSLLRIGHESEFAVERKIQQPGELVELEPTKRTFKPSSQPTQTPCPHCGDLVYVLATTCIHCRGPLRFNPAVQKGSLEAYRILTGWKAPKLDPPTGQEPIGGDDSPNSKSADENTQSGAPQFKEKLPNDPDNMAFLKAFRRTWTAARDTTQFCEAYAEKNCPADDKAPDRLRNYVYRYLKLKK